MTHDRSWPLAILEATEADMSERGIEEIVKNLHDAAAVAPRVDGKFMSAFVRARKPARA